MSTFFEYKGHLLEAVRYCDIEYREPEICIDQLMRNWKVRKQYKPSMQHPWRKGTLTQRQV